MIDRTGTMLGKYHLLRKLGQGGFAEVYLGTHEHLQTPAALKVLFANLAQREDIEEFRREAQVIARLSHPYIIRVLDFDIEQSTPYLVMDYAPGGSLRTRYARGQRLPLETVSTSVQHLAEALQYAHESRLIHRDVKPENMLIGSRSTLLLSDFGIATIAHSTSSRRTESWAGTPTYMAPEQMQGKPQPASDQYALGIVIYEWLTGQPPFRGTPMEIAMQHAMASPPAPSGLVQHLPSGIDEVLLTALAKQPEKRFANVATFALAFQQAVQRGNTATSPAAHRHLPPTQRAASSSESVKVASSQGNTPLSPPATAVPSSLANALQGRQTPGLPSPLTPPLTPASRRKDSRSKLSGKQASQSMSSLTSDDPQIAGPLPRSSPLSKPQKLLELETLLQRVEKQGMTKLALGISLTSFIPIAFVCFNLLSPLANTLGIPQGRILGLLVALCSLTVWGVFSYPLFRFSEKSARDQLVKKVTQETFQTTKELAEEIKRLQKQIGK